jgi:hypothetical protein
MTRTHAQQDIDLMSYGDIAKRMGYADASTPAHICHEAMAKLRRLLDSRRDEIRELYAPEPETTQPLSKIGSQWKVSELRPVELMPKRGK